LNMNIKEESSADFVWIYLSAVPYLDKIFGIYLKG